MKIDSLRDLCLSFPYTTEHVQWGNHLVFKVAGKIYAVAALEIGPTWLMFKCSPEIFADLTERQGIIPAPYLARAKWVALETQDALPAAEIASLLRTSYDLVFAKLPRNLCERLASNPPAKSRRPRSRKASKRADTAARHPHKSKKRAPR
jgi:predicted DNA-binding protein (MmcQ/YjbR family)